MFLDYKNTKIILYNVLEIF